MTISSGDTNETTRVIDRNKITRLISKRDTQKMIKALRDAGLTVNKDTAGFYSCDHVQHKGTEKTITRLFTAMPGRSGYLVNMRADLFV
jgi:5-enolpyruvylshikimate-3-phosphate synthase